MRKIYTISNALESINSYKIPVKKYKILDAYIFSCLRYILSVNSPSPLSSVCPINFGYLFLVFSIGFFVVTILLKTLTPHTCPRHSQHSPVKQLIASDLFICEVASKAMVEENWWKQRQGKLSLRRSNLLSDYTDGEFFLCLCSLPHITCNKIFCHLRSSKV